MIDLKNIFINNLMNLYYLYSLDIILLLGQMLCYDNYR